MEPARLHDDAFISRLVVVPNFDTGHERVAHVKSPGHPVTIISLEALAIIPGAKVLIYNYYFEYYICYERRVKELLAQFNLAADYVNAKRYQLSTWPLAIAPRPWAFTIRVMLHQWRDTMENNARLRLAVDRLHGLLHSDPPALVRQQPGFSSTLIRRWRVSSSA